MTDDVILWAFAHRDVSRIATRLYDLSANSLLKNNERDRAISASARMESLATEFWRDLNDMDPDPLPDPGCRPLETQFWPGACDKEPDLQATLGYFHRCREFADKLDAAISSRKGGRR